MNAHTSLSQGAVLGGTTPAAAEAGRLDAVVLLFHGDSLVAAGLDRDEAEAALLAEHVGDDLEVGVETGDWIARLDAVEMRLDGPRPAVSALLALITVNQRAGVVLGAGLEAFQSPFQSPTGPAFITAGQAEGLWADREYDCAELSLPF
ncbi:MAG: hypothetical protein JNM72_12225 [Deltaproteobacteria bacterium]|nr:hypothetical protein [Deltaproteobacteria bacterium]